jgi:HK97 family phage portal protein
LEGIAVSLFFKRRGEERSHWFGTDSYGPTGGHRVSEETASRLAPVFAAYRHIVDYTSTLPIDVYMGDGSASKESSLPPLLARQDEDGGPGLDIWIGQAAYGLANGNAVGWITKTDSFGYPIDVYWLHWNQWSYDELSRQWYVFGENVPSSQLVHIPWIVPPGRRLGLSPIEHMAAIICAGMSAQEYADVKRGGGIPPAVLKNTQKTMQPDAADVIKQRAVASFARGEPFVTGVDWDLSLLTIPPNQAQFVETLKMSANQIAAAYGIDPTEVGGQAANSLTYSTEELRQINRAANMRPYLTRLERGLSRVMPLKQYMKFNIDATMRVDLKTRTDVVGAQILDGRLSVNEARALEDNAPVAGGDFHNIPHDIANPVHAPLDRPKGVRSEGVTP